jgi:hypothetical protein
VNVFYALYFDDGSAATLADVVSHGDGLAVSASPRNSSEISLSA